MSYCTAINCIDGRTQLPVIAHLKKRFNVEYVDVITEAGPNLILAENLNKSVVQSILDRVRISIEAHDSVGIAITGHYDCAGNPADPQKQIQQIKQARRAVADQFKNVEIIGLWVDENWEVRDVNDF